MLAIIHNDEWDTMFNAVTFMNLKAMFDSSWCKYVSYNILKITCRQQTATSNSDVSNLVFVKYYF